MRSLFALGLATLVLIVSACGDRQTNVNVNTQSSNPNSPSQVITSRIEFRVSGNANSVKIRYTTQADGIVQTVTTLPFFTSFNTNADELFLELDVTPISYSALVQFPFLSAQIYVNGNLFREATAGDFFLNTLTVSGNWRR